MFCRKVKTHFQSERYWDWLYIYFWLLIDHFYYKFSYNKQFYNYLNKMKPTKVFSSNLLQNNVRMLYKYLLRKSLRLPYFHPCRSAVVFYSTVFSILCLRPPLIKLCLRDRSNGMVYEREFARGWDRHPAVFAAQLTCWYVIVCALRWSRTPLWLWSTLFARFQIGIWNILLLVVNLKILWFTYSRFCFKMDMLNVIIVFRQKRRHLKPILQ